MISSSMNNSKQNTLKYDPDLVEPKPLPSFKAINFNSQTQIKYFKDPTEFKQSAQQKQKQTYSNIQQPVLSIAPPQFLYGEVVNSNLKAENLPPKYEEVEYRKEIHAYRVLDPIKNETIIKEPVWLNGSIRPVEFMKPVYKDFEIDVGPENFEVIKNKTIYQKFGDPLPDFSKMDLNPSTVAKNYKEAKELFERFGLNSMEIITPRPKETINFNVNPENQILHYNKKNENDNLILHTDDFININIDTNMIKRRYIDPNSKTKIKKEGNVIFAKVTKLNKDTVIKNKPKISIKQNNKLIKDYSKTFVQKKDRKPLKKENNELFVPLLKPKILHNSINEPIPIIKIPDNYAQPEVIYQSFNKSLKSQTHVSQKEYIDDSDQHSSKIPNLNENIIKKNNPQNTNSYSSLIISKKEKTYPSVHSSQEEIAVHSAHTSEMSGDFGSSVKKSKEQNIQISKNKEFSN